MGNLRPDPARIRIIDNETIAGGATYYSPVINLRSQRPNGFASLHVHATGTGTVTITPEGSNNYGDPTSTDSGGDFLKPSTASAVVTGHTATSGPAGDGKEIYDSKYWGMPVTDKFRFKVVNTAGTAITITAWYCTI